MAGDKGSQTLVWGGGGGGLEDGIAMTFSPSHLLYTINGPPRPPIVMPLLPLTVSG